jgi:hypothetical protein
VTSLALVAPDPLRWRTAIRKAGARVTGRVVVTTFAIAIALQVWSLYDAALAAPDSVASKRYVSLMIVNVLIAFSIMFTTFVADEVVERGAPPLPVYAFGVLVGSASGTFAQWLVHEVLDRAPASIPGLESGDRAANVVFVFFEYLIWGTIGVWIYVNRRSEMRAKARMDASRLQRAETQRRSLETQLAALQAQVEPGFLLDMLACARDRYEADAASGSAMLGALISYLRTALPRLRETASTLGRELELVRAYLDVMREHLGDDTLAFEFDVAEGLCGARMPAMLMLPLIHAIVVGRSRGSQLQPPRLILASARIADGRLRVRLVHDAVTGTGAVRHRELDGIRRRLQALYRGDATLAMHHGTTAILEIPFESPDGDHR